MALLVLVGPPLPGRWSLARALQEQLGARRFVAEEGGLLPLGDARRALERGELVLVDGNLPSEGERRGLLDALGATTQLLVEWRCHRAQAQREIFHRYAHRPRLMARDELRRYLADARLRQPVARELAPAQQVLVHAEQPLAEQVARVTAQLPDGAARRAAPRPSPSARRVMVVEDDADERALLAEVLAELGFAVELAPDAGVALALLDEGIGVELLLSDHRMPGMTGVELSQVLAERHPDVRTVLLTAYGDADTCRAAVAANAVTVLSKPLSVIDLERVLDEATAHA